MCNVLSEQNRESVAALILVCGGGDREAEFIDYPIHIYLERPLGDRTVNDIVQERRPVPYRNVYRELEQELPR